MRYQAHKVGAVFYVLWGVVHVIAGAVMLNALSAGGGTAALAVLGNAVDASQLPQIKGGVASSAIGLISWDLVWFGTLITVIAVTLNWHNSRVGFWISLFVVLATDLSYMVAIIEPGYVAFPRGFMGPPLGVLAIGFSVFGYLRRVGAEVGR